MTTNQIDTEPLEEPLAQLETRLIKEYLARLGQDLHVLRARGDEEARTLLADASVYAAGRLTEIEARTLYLRHLRGEA